MHLSSFPHLRPSPHKIPAIARQSQRPTPAGLSKSYGFRVRSCGEATGPPPRGKNEAVAELLGERVEELLKREENRPLLEGLEEASLSVERARATLADIERRKAKSVRAQQLPLQLQDRESEIAETQKELVEARAMVEEAELSLSITMEESYDFSKEAERWESIKAAAISSIAGTLASLPISLYRATSFTELSLHTAITFLLSALLVLFSAQSEGI